MADHHLVLSPKTVRALVRLVEENALSELTLEGEGYAVTIKADAAVVVTPAARAPAAPPAPVVPPADEEERLALRAPMTGIFYHSPTPGEPPFVHVGDRVEIGQVIGVIEAMKVFSEVPADAAGRVAEIPAENGRLVHQGDALVVLASDDASDTLPESVL